MITILTDKAYHKIEEGGGIKIYRLDFPKSGGFELQIVVQCRKRRK